MVQAQNVFSHKLLAVAISGVAYVSGAQLALAQDQSEKYVLEEVMVTARKREESLQDISAAVSLVGADRLQKNVINDVRDLQNIVPSLNVGEAVGITKINMRGLGNSTVTRSEDSEVVLHVDGVVISRMEAQSLAFFDLERIEVLRGPQGTLYGRNSTGGTVNLITAKPTEEFSGYLSATAGNYGLIKIEAAAGGALTDTVKGRVAVQSIDRDGYSENRVNGKDFNDDSRWAARAHLMVDFSEDISLLLSSEYAKEDDASGHLTFLDTLTGATPADPSIYSSPDSRDGLLSGSPKMERETSSFTATFDWNISDTFSIRNIANYRELDFLNFADLDVSSAALADVSLPLEDRQVSNELQFIYSDDRLNLMAGVFYFDEKFNGTQDVFVYGSDTAFRYFGESNTEVLSPFWNGSYMLNDTITLRAGGRLNREDRDIYNALGVGTVSGGLDVIMPTIVPPAANDKRSFNEYTGEYGIDYQFSENTMMYYTFSQGYRAGAALIFQTNSGIIDPTTVDNHEIGLKTQTEDRRLTANLAVFDATVSDLQRTQASLTSTGALDTRINNIDEMSVRGAELEVFWNPAEQFRINGTIVFIDAEFDNFLTDDPFDGVVQEIQVAGNRPRQTPEWKSNVHAEYDFSVANDGILTASLDWSYVGKQYFDEFNRAPLEEDGYSLIDASFTYYPAGDNWSVSLWGKNLTDEKKIYDANFSAFGGIKNKFLTNPLTWGVSARYEF